MPDTVSPRLYDALLYAFALHGRDSRKSSPTPVLAHLLSVCAIVQTDGGTEDEAIAALLHDALEDKPTETSEEIIRERFGQCVAMMVRAATDTPANWKGGPKPPWRERKEAYIAHISNSSAALLRPTIADKIDNVRALLADHARHGDDLWKRFNAGKHDQVWYYDACCQAYENVGAAPRLTSELRVLVEEFRRIADPRD